MANPPSSVSFFFSPRHDLHLHDTWKSSSVTAGMSIILDISSVYNDAPWPFTCDLWPLAPTLPGWQVINWAAFGGKLQTCEPLNLYGHYFTSLRHSLLQGHMFWWIKLIYFMLLVCDCVLSVLVLKKILKSAFLDKETKSMWVYLGIWLEKNSLWR